VPTFANQSSLWRADRALSQGNYYEASVQRPPAHPPLQGDLRCDVAVVGAGLAGLSAALELRARGLQVVLLEAQRIGSGASGRNGGQAIHGLACEQALIESQLGLDAARQVWDMSIEALDLLRQRVQQHPIDCEWQDGYLGVATSPAKARALWQWAERIEKVYGYSLQILDPAATLAHVASPRYYGGIRDPRSGHLHPLKYTLGLAHAAVQAGVSIHEHTAVTRIDALAGPAGAVVGATGGGSLLRLKTAQGTVCAAQVLLAGNVQLPGLAPQFAATLGRRIMPVGTFIACTEPLRSDLARSLIPGREAVCDSNFVLDYFRTTADQRMLYGGRVSYSTLAPSDLKRSMQRRMIATFAQLRGHAVDYAWGGFVDITMNRAPDFGRVPWQAITDGQTTGKAGQAQVYYLQGFSGHGLALTGLAGRLVAEAMAGDASRFDVFARLRHHNFPGGRSLRTPALVLAMAWYRLRDMLG